MNITLKFCFLAFNQHGGVIGHSIEQSNQPIAILPIKITQHMRQHKLRISGMTNA